MIKWILLLQLAALLLQLNAQRGDVLIDFNSLSNNVVPFDQYQPSFTLLASEKRTYQVYLAGETHGVGINQQLQYDLLTYLHKHHEVRNLILEMPYSFSYPLNLFLESGDSSVLHQTLYTGKSGSVFSSRETFEFFTKLRSFNISKPYKDRIKIQCIDVEHIPSFTYSCLNYILDRSDEQNELIPIRKKLEKWTSEAIVPEDLTVRQIEYLTSQMEKYTILYQEVLKDSYQDYYLILKNLNNTYQDKREDNMYDNFIEQSKTSNPGNYFGQLGGLHVINKKRWFKEKTFAEKLNYRKNSLFKDQVLSIMYIYDNCSRINYKGRYTLGLIEPDSFKKIKNAVAANFAFLKINTEGHILKEEAKHYAYIILIKNQDAMLPLKPRSIDSN